MSGNSDDDGAVVEPLSEEDDRTIEPGTPNLENVVFVILGAVLTIFVLLRGMGFL